MAGSVQAALATVVTEQERLTNDLYPPKVKATPTTTTTSAHNYHDDWTIHRGASQCVGDNADASIDPFAYYTDSNPCSSRRSRHSRAF